VWDAIEDTPAQAENMKLRSELAMVLKDHIARTGLSQSEAARLSGVTQPRISDLMRSKIELFGLPKSLCTIRERTTATAI
jgi:predicted XRE-type DNA-binding protein